MADEAASDSKIEDMDIESMKVADLKKKLKDIGLPVTGNKSELVERLQASLLAPKNDDDATPGDIESSCSELDSSLLNDSKLNSSEDKDISQACDTDELLQSSPEKSKESPVVTTSAFIPLKKRVVAQTSAGSPEKPKEKKIVLNRNHIPTPKFIPNKPAEPLKTVTFTDDKSDIIKNIDTKEASASAITIQEGTNKIRLTAAKTISEDERISLRAKRFNITAPEPASKSGKIAISSKKDVASNVTSTSSSILTPSATGPSLDVLQKRALRFGVNVSKVLKQLEEQQKVLKRKSKFEIGNGVQTAEEQEKKKKRAERFGML